MQHALVAMTFIAVQLGLLTLAQEKIPNHLFTGWFSLAIPGVIYVPVILVSWHDAKRKVGAIITQATNPIHHSRLLWASIFVFVVCVALLLLDGHGLIVQVSCIYLVYLAVATFMPTAIIGTAGIAHSLGIFTPWRDWKIAEESNGEFLVLKSWTILFPQKLYLRRDLLELPEIERLIRDSRPASG